MLPRNYIPKEKNSVLGYKVAKDRLNLLLGANAAGECKLKPMFVYLTLNPRALKDLVKGTLPVIWRCKSKTGVSSKIFEVWFSHHVVPEVKNILLIIIIF
jgi:hypothetical protein